MTVEHWRYECDNDLIHDELNGATSIVDLDAEQAELAAILHWPLTGPAHARLTPQQVITLADLIAWRKKAAVPGVAA
jgi:hypothetical protein